MTTPLQTAAQHLIDRWDSPLWKDQPHTGVYIAELRKALAYEQAQAVEPVCSQCKGLGYYDEGHENDDGSMSGGNYVDCACNKKDFTQCTTVTNDCLGGCKSLSEHQNYTHPAPPAEAQQVAVPMTTTEIRKVYAFVPYREIESTVNYLDFARAIEAHHGINQGAKP